MALYFSSLNFPTALRWHNSVFVSYLEELFVNCFASRTASFVDVLPQIQNLAQQRRKLKKNVIFIRGVFFGRESFPIVLFNILFYLIEKGSLILHGFSLVTENKTTPKK